MAASTHFSRIVPPPVAGENVPAKAVLVRGIPLHVADQAPHAIHFGYCPVSSTGYRSHYGQSLPSPAALEDIAREADRQRASALQRLREAKAKSPKGRTPDQRFSDFVSLEGAISAAVNHAYLAPPAEQDRLLREIATATQALEPFLKPGHAKPANPGSHWTTELLAERAQAYHGLCALTCRLLARLHQRGKAIDLAAWTAFVNALPGGPGFSMRPPTVLLKLLGQVEDKETGDKNDAPKLKVHSAAAPRPTHDIEEDQAAPKIDLPPAELVAASAPVWAVDKRGQFSLF
ncbi:hypothetical protein [Azospirillum argentinense]|uniref:Uncharacterized protein n=1 Tax=Azospirillum argentinense TaxID=2970906 RepID=A0A5B0KPD7_9PROT|nr:hypothetical protein [Azospirillum argentinense]KAA1053761.1 hypothetical protein FH063_002343 [Azospirillum argentinense]